MKKSFNYLAIIILLFNSAAFAGGSERGSTLSTLTGTLKNIKHMIEVAQGFVETKFEQHQSGTPGTKTVPPFINLIGGGTVASPTNPNNQYANPYVSIFQMLPNYILVMKFSPNSQAGLTINLLGNIYSVTNPVAQALLGTEFVFIPIYNPKDNQITSWTCFTNADYYRSEYKAQNVMPLYERSYIADAAEEAGVPELSQCIYMGPTLASFITPYTVIGFQ